MRVCPAFVAGLPLAVGFAALPASAAPQPEAARYALGYRAANGCPDEASVAADVRAHVRDPAHGAGLRLELEIVPTEDGFHGALVSTDERGQRGERAVDGRDCAEVAHALAFLASVAIDLAGTEAPDTRIAGSEAPSHDTPQSSAPSSTPESAAARAEHGEGGGWSSLAAVAFGELKGGFASTIGQGVGGGIDLQDERPSLVAPTLRTVLLGVRGQLALEPNPAEVWLLAGRVELCPIHWHARSIDARPCGGFELGTALLASPAISFGSGKKLTLWSAAEITLRFQWRMTAAAFLEVAGGPVFPITRPRAESSDLAFEVPALTGRGAALVGFRL